MGILWKNHWIIYIFYLPRRDISLLFNQIKPVYQVTEKWERLIFAWLHDLRVTS
jgi:hypothetical protein